MKYSGGLWYIILIYCLDKTLYINVSLILTALQAAKRASFNSLSQNLVAASAMLFPSASQSAHVCVVVVTELHVSGTILNCVLKKVMKLMKRN